MHSSACTYEDKDDVGVAGAPQLRLHPSQRERAVLRVECVLQIARHQHQVVLHTKAMSAERKHGQ
jgi:hypothetical protein